MCSSPRRVEVCYEGSSKGSLARAGRSSYKDRVSHFLGVEGEDKPSNVTTSLPALMPPTLPPVHPKQTVSGIAVDPQSLERVIPESRRPDGSVRKEIKIRPGFTPQEDVRIFRGTRQAQHDANQLPKGHIIGWTPPPQSSAAPSKPLSKLSKSAKKNAKRRENKKKEVEEAVAENWEDDDADDQVASAPTTSARTPVSVTSDASSTAHTPEKPNWAAAASEETLTRDMDKLKV
ncbi:RNA binding protein [Mycena kentingensis (nom. inval.)]|nr:RNA binding protein [Mycena kentingensis (nom. inval.)]